MSKPVATHFIMQRLKSDNLQGITKTAYLQHIKRFQQWLTAQGMKHLESDRILEQLQPYVDDMAAQGLSPHTIHTYVGGIIKGLEPELRAMGYGTPKKPLYAAVHLPKRGLSTKGRDDTKRCDRNADNRYIVDFAEKVGLRRAEYKRLKGKDLVEKDGRMYVSLDFGKGRKPALQMILPQDEDFVRMYFDGKHPDAYIFSKEECDGLTHANAHALRRAHARDFYEWVKHLPFEERERLLQELRGRFMQKYDREVQKGRMTPSEARERAQRLFDKQYLDGRVYRTRGAVRGDMGQEKDLDRLALLATSVFSLSHWRNNVTAESYMR